MNILESFTTRNEIYKDYTSGKNILIRGEKYSGKTDYILSLASTIAEVGVDTKIAIVFDNSKMEPYIEYFINKNNIKIKDNTIEYPNKSIIHLIQDIDDVKGLTFNHVMIDNASHYLDIDKLMATYVTMVSSETPSLLIAYNFSHDNSTIKRLENMSINPRQPGKKRGDYILYDII